MVLVVTLVDFKFFGAGGWKPGKKMRSLRKDSIGMKSVPKIYLRLFCLLFSSVKITTTETQTPVWLVIHTNLSQHMYGVKQNHKANIEASRNMDSSREAMLGEGMICIVLVRRLVYTYIHVCVGTDIHVRVGLLVRHIKECCYVKHTTFKSQNLDYLTFLQNLGLWLITTNGQF